MIDFDKIFSMFQCFIHIAHKIENELYNYYKNSIVFLLISEEISNHGSYEFTTIHKKMKLFTIIGAISFKLSTI
jgi:hypothetical protein